MLGFSIFINSDQVNDVLNNAKREADADYNDDTNNHHGSSFGRLLNPNQNFHQILPNDYDDRLKHHQQDRSRLVRMHRQRVKTYALQIRHKSILVILTSTK